MLGHERECGIRRFRTPSGRTITVFDAYGHAGRFVVAELRSASGHHSRRPGCREIEGDERSAARIGSSGGNRGHPVSVNRALSGAAAVINCAAPFLASAETVINAAMRAGIPYLDVAAEQPAVLSVFERFAGIARDAGVVIISAMAFYGGLGDLRDTAAMENWDYAEEISIATAPPRVPLRPPQT